MGNLNNTKKHKHFHVKMDRLEKPRKMKLYVRVLAWILSFSDLWARRHKLEKINMEGIDGPYLLLVNHNAFLDFKVVTKATFPKGVTNVVAIDGFIKREKLLRDAGCIMKRKFTNDPILVRHIIYAIRKLKQTVVLYPEARYSLDGTQSKLPHSLGKLIKLLNVPVVVLITKGHFIDSSVWNLKHKNPKVRARMIQVLTQNDTQQLSVEDINYTLKRVFRYDDFAYQRDEGIKIFDPKRAEGLHKILYKCPHCLTEHKMTAHDHLLVCEACHYVHAMDNYGQLQGLKGMTYFHHIPEWMHWQRDEVAQEIKNNTYHIEDTVSIDALPNTDGFIPLGKGKLIHNAHGFHLTYEVDGVLHELIKTPESMQACHVEFNYNQKGDCIDLTTLDDNFYLYFDNLKNVVTKIAIATEILYDLAMEADKQVKP